MITSMLLDMLLAWYPSQHVSLYVTKKIVTQHDTKNDAYESATTNIITDIHVHRFFFQHWAWTEHYTHTYVIVQFSAACCVDIVTCRSCCINLYIGRLCRTYDQSNFSAAMDFTSRYMYSMMYTIVWYYSFQIFMGRSTLRSAENGRCGTKKDIK